MYCIINKTARRVEAVYDDYIAANIIARNLNRSYNGKYEFIIKESLIEDRPTSRQMYRIKQIEAECNIEFQGITKTDAKLFLEKYINMLNEI